MPNGEININTENLRDIESIVNILNDCSTDDKKEEIINNLKINKESYKIFCDNNGALEDISNFKFDNSKENIIYIAQKLSDDSKITIIDENGYNSFDISKNFFCLTEKEINEEYKYQQYFLKFIQSRIGNVANIKDKQGRDLIFNNIDLDYYWLVDLSEDLNSDVDIVDGKHCFVKENTKIFFSKILTLNKIDITLQRIPNIKIDLNDDFYYSIKDDLKKKILTNFLTIIHDNPKATYKEIIGYIKKKYPFIKTTDKDNNDSPVFDFIKTPEQYNTQDPFLLDTINIEELNYDGDNIDLLTKKTIEIEFGTTDNYTYINDSVKDLFKTKTITLKDENIDEKTKVFDFIKKKYFKPTDNIEKASLLSYDNNVNYVEIDKNNFCFTKGISKYKVHFNGVIPNITKYKDIKINVKFKVTNEKKFNLRNWIKDRNDIIIEGGKSYDDLLNVIKEHLNNKDLKEGFKINEVLRVVTHEFNKKDKLKDGATYIVYFADDDPNFVEKILDKTSTKDVPTEGEKPVERKPTEEDKHVERKPTEEDKHVERKPTEEDKQ